MPKTRSGFTLVELLIVIVIIAILAAITIVAYNGIQDRASRTAEIQAATEIVQRMDAAVVSDGVNFGVGAPYCIPGTAIDANGDGTADCEANGTNRTDKPSVDTMFANASITGLQFPNTQLTDSSGKNNYGIQLTYGSGGYGVDGVHQPYFVYFTLKGTNQDCSSGYSIGGTPGNNNTTNPLTAYTHTRNYSSNTYGNTICAFTIMQPENS